MAAIGRELGLAQTLSINRLVTKLQEIHGVEEKSKVEVIAEAVTADIGLDEAPAIEISSDQVLTEEAPSADNS